MFSTAPVTSRIPSGLQTFKYVMRQNPPAPVAFTAAATTQTTTLFGLPGEHVIIGVVVKLVTTFEAFGLSSVLVTLGVAGNTNWYAPAYELTQAASSTSFRYWSPFTTFTMDPHDIIATFTSTGAQLATLTAGEVEFTVLYRSL